MLENISYISSVLFLGIFFSVLFYPITSKVEAFFQRKQGKKKYHRFLRVCSVLLCYLFFFLLLCLSLSLFYMSISSYFSGISWDEWAVKIIANGRSILEKIPFFSYPSWKEKAMELCFSILKNAAEKTVKLVGIQLMKLPKMLGKIGLGVVISMYLLIDRDTYVSFFSSRTKKMEVVRDKLKRAGKLFFAYWKGQAMDAVFMGVAISAGLFFLKVPLGIGIGILAGFGNLIPYVGPILAYAGTIFFCVVEKKIKTLWLALVYLILIQQIDGSYIGPKLIGKYVNLPPLLIVLAVLVGGSLFGILGMMLAVPVTAILREMARK